MNIFRMADIIPLLQIKGPIKGRSSFYTACPRCDCNPNDKHLNINLAKNVFRCPKCGWSGGVLDLFAEFSGVPRKSARSELSRIFNGDTQLRYRKGDDSLRYGLP